MQWSLPYVVFLPLWKFNFYSSSQTWFKGPFLLSHLQHLPTLCTGLWRHCMILSTTIHLRVYCNYLVSCVSHRLNGHEFEQAPGVGDGQGSCAAVHRVSKSQTQLNDWIELNWCVSLKFSLKTGLGPGRRWLGWRNVLSNCWTKLEWGAPRNSLGIMGPKLLTNLVACTEHPFCINCWRLCQRL